MQLDKVIKGCNLFACIVVNEALLFSGNQTEVSIQCSLDSQTDEVESQESHTEGQSSNVNMHRGSVRRRPLKHNAKRPCMYCGLVQTNLNRHLLNIHKTEELVIAVKNAPNKQRRDRLFEKMRKKGMFIYNRKILAQSEIGALQRERAVKDSKAETVFCTNCQGFYSSSYFSVHKKKCSYTDSSESEPKAVKTELLTTKFEVSEEFKAVILTRFKDNEIGHMCRNDELIALFGVYIG